MTVIVAPIDAVGDLPLFTSQQLRETGAALVDGGDARNLSGHSGYRPGTKNPLTATATTWTVAPCSGLIDTGFADAGALYPWAVQIMHNNDKNT